MLRISQLSVTGLCLIALCGCGTFLGTKTKKPLPGERISILVHEQTLEPDAGTENETIRLPAPTPNLEWPQAGGYPNHAMHHIKVGDRLQEIWSTGIGSGSSTDDKLITQPVVAGDRIFTMDSESVVRAFDISNGDEVWEIDLIPDHEDDGHVSGGLAVENDKLFVTTGFAEVIALNIEDGKILWRRNIGTPMRAPPAVRGNRVFAVTLTNKLFALNGSTGKTLWNHAGIEEGTNFLGGAAPAVDGGVVVVPYSSGEVAALKVENGQELWNDSLAVARRPNSTTLLSSIRGRPVIDRGIVTVISNSNLITAINLRTGRRIWDRAIGGIESPWVAGEFIFVLTNNSEMVALGRRTGRIHWVTPLPQWEDPKDKEGRIIWTGPILISDRLIVAGSNGEAMSVSPYTGKVLGKVEMPDGVTISPIVANGTVFFLSDDADLVAYR
jgi:outer membrane protein assembly factor BamB